VKFEVVTAVTVKITVLWDVTSCNLIETYRRFGGRQSIFELQECSEIEGCTFLQNVGIFLPHYTAPYPRRRLSYLGYILVVCRLCSTYVKNRFCSGIYFGQLCSLVVSAMKPKYVTYNCSYLRLLVSVKRYKELLLIFFFPMARQPYMGLGLLVSSRFHDHIL
jgi:hypothetical protein